jgi:hypothetical protein
MNSLLTSVLLIVADIVSIRKNLWRGHFDPVQGVTVVPEHAQGRDQQPQTHSTRFEEPRCVVFRYDPVVPPC